jgi:hypothetical protein
MLLSSVSSSNARSDPNDIVVPIAKLDDVFEHRRLTADVWPDNRNSFTTGEIEIDIFEQRIIVESLRIPSYLQNNIRLRLPANELRTNCRNFRQWSVERLLLFSIQLRTSRPQSPARLFAGTSTRREFQSLHQCFVAGQVVYGLRCSRPAAPTTLVDV